MAGNSQRRGSVRKASTKKGATKGTGGNGREALAGRGATPKAEERTWHVAHKNKVARERLETKRAQHAPRNKQNRAGDRVTEIVAGRNSVLESLRANLPVTKIFIATRLEHDDRTKEILAIANERSIPLFEAGKPELDRMTDGSIHQGVAISVPPYNYADVEDLLDIADKAGQPPLIVALDSITDPRNLGAVLRSAGAFGAHGVLVPERRAAGVTASAWKVSAGAAARVKVARETNLVRSLEQLKKAGCFVIGLDGGGDMDVSDISFANDGLVIVLGSEGSGLSRLVRETCDAIVSIPISAAVESLNAGVAASITLYEVAKARAEQA